MKRLLYIPLSIALLFSSCKDDEKVFEKSAAQRSTEAIAALKADLTANPWKVKYQPEESAGAFWVLMDFKENNEVEIKTDLDADDERYHEQTVTYRIDSSLGLELIIESYSFFSFLFELDQASFGAEYEFLYANKTPNGELVFTSKTDIGIPTILLFEEAESNDDNLLGQDLSNNLNVLAEDLDRFSSSNKLTYVNKDLILYLSLDELRRTISITSGARKSDPNLSEAIDFTTGYYLQTDSLIFLETFSENITGIVSKIKGIKLADPEDAELAVCASPSAIHIIPGVTSSNDAVILSPTITDATGGRFKDVSDFYYLPLEYIFLNGDSQYEQVTADLPEALAMQIYWGSADLDDDGTDDYAIGFVFQNSAGEVAFVLKQFSFTLDKNNVIFNFEDDYTYAGGEIEVDTEMMDKYLDYLTEGNKTFVYRYAEDIYEFNNPCTGWSFAFLNGRD